MLTIRSFFSPDPDWCTELFNPDHLVWEPLNGLKDYMSSMCKNGLTVPKEGCPLPDHLIYHEGELFKAEDYSIQFGDTTKGGLIVTGKDGNVLEGASVIMAGAVITGTGLILGKSSLIESGAMIKGPTIIGDMTEVRQGAYLRGYCLAGNRCVLGHTTEIKHSIFLDDAKAGHFAYVGDSILGRDANLGAGTKFANLRFLPGNVSITIDGKKTDTGRRKFGAILGDSSQTGCNSVTSPGTIMGKKSILMPNTTARGGYYPNKSVLR